MIEIVALRSSPIRSTLILIIFVVIFQVHVIITLSVILGVVLLIVMIVAATKPAAALIVSSSLIARSSSASIGAMIKVSVASEVVRPSASVSREVVEISPSSSSLSSVREVSPASGSGWVFLLTASVLLRWRGWRWSAQVKLAHRGRVRGVG